MDALIVTAPDHWHSPAAILACKAGKHVFLEKPASHNPNEGEMVVAAAKKQVLAGKAAVVMATMLKKVV